MSERSQAIKKRETRLPFGQASDATESAQFMVTATHAGMQTLAARRWQSASLKAKVRELEDHIDFIVKNCARFVSVIYVEMTDGEIARICSLCGQQWLYRSALHRRFVFELKRAKG